MPRERSPNRDKAFEIYKEHGGKIDLVEIAAMLKISDGTVRGWKNKDNWDGKLNGTFQKNKRNAPKEKVKESSDKKKQQEVNNNAEVDIYELTDMQRLFAEIYVKNFNATQAAIKAGYSPNSAMEQGYQLLRKTSVRAYVNYLKELKKQSIMLSEDDIVERYMRIAFADMTDFVNFGQQDIPIMGQFGPICEVDPETGRRIILTERINTMRIKEDYEVDGGLICEIKVGKKGTSLKLEDRQKALDWLANYFEMNPENKHKVQYDNAKLEIERERLKLEKIKVTGEGKDDKASKVIIVDDIEGEDDGS